MEPLQTNRRASCSLSVVLPCYNPPDEWHLALQKNMTELNALLPGYTIQYVVYNDGSERIDSASANATALFPGVLFIDGGKNLGKGAALRKGTEQACGTIIIYSDLDFPFGVPALTEIVQIFENDPACDFVYGKRCPRYFRILPFKRRLVSQALHLVNRLFLSREIFDTQAGLKGIRGKWKDVVLSTRTNTFVFDIELIRNLIRRKMTIKHIDVTPVPGIRFTDFRPKTLLTESINLSKILIQGILWSQNP